MLPSSAVFLSTSGQTSYKEHCQQQTCYLNQVTSAYYFTYLLRVGIPVPCLIGRLQNISDLGMCSTKCKTDLTRYGSMQESTYNEGSPITPSFPFNHTCTACHLHMALVMIRCASLGTIKKQDKKWWKENK